MAAKTNSQNGFHVIEIIVVIAVITLVGGIVWRFITTPMQQPNPSQPVATQSPQASDATPTYVGWQWGGDKWMALNQGKPAPACENPLTIAAPMDVTKATSVLYPGQNRGGDFKPHGGIGIDNATSNAVTVSAVRDAYLFRGARYIEQGEVQYMFDFTDSCGVMYRLDHLAVLSDEFKQYAEKLPVAQENSSATQNFADRIFVKKGTVIATAVGFEKTRNAFFDLGVYDLRAPNAASKTAIYQTDSLRMSDKEQSFYALCWFDLLPAKDKAIVKSLPARDATSGKASDYCSA